MFFIVTPVHSVNMWHVIISCDILCVCVQCDECAWRGVSEGGRGTCRPQCQHSAVIREEEICTSQVAHPHTHTTHTLTPLPGLRWQMLRRDPLPRVTTPLPALVISLTLVLVTTRLKPYQWHSTTDSHQVLGTWNHAQLLTISVRAAVRQWTVEVWRRWGCV